MKYCTECGTQLLQDDLFCAGCGTPVGQLIESDDVETNDDYIDQAAVELLASAAHDRSGPEKSLPATDPQEPARPPTWRTDGPDQMLPSTPTGSDHNTKELRLDWRDSAPRIAATADESSAIHEDTGPPENTSLNDAKLSELEGRLNEAIHEFTEGHISAATLARIEAELAPEISQARRNTDEEDTGNQTVEPQSSEGSDPSGWMRKNPIATWTIAGLVGLLLVVGIAVGLGGGDGDDGVPDPSEWRDNPIPEEADPFVVSTYCQQGAPISQSGANYSINDALNSPTQYGPGRVVLVWSDGSQTYGGGAC